MPISVPGASYASGASIYTPTYASGSSIYTPVYLVVENGQIIYNFPVNIEAPIVSGTAQVGQVLSCSTGTWEGKPTIAYSYLWIRETGGAGTPIVGATSSNYTLQAADYGYKVHCQVTATNDFGTGVAQSTSSGTVTENVPVNTVLPAISGSTVVGQTLTSSTGTWTSISSLSYAYQWKRAGSVIVGATSSTYVLVTADYGNTITCTVTATNAAGPASATSNATASITESAPVNTVAPVASGNVFYGVQLSCTTGTWTSITAPTYGYQWKRNGSNIGGATSSTYTCAEADEGQNITCSVTATNTGGSTSQGSNTLSNWIPSTLSPTLWLDANHPSGINSGTPVNGDAVGTWVDRSANASSYTQSTAAKKPTYTTNVLNSKAGLLFDSSNNQQLTSSAVTTLNRTQAFTIVAVVKVSSFPTQFRYLFNAKGSASSSPSMGFSTNAGFQDAFFGDDSSVNQWKVFRMSTISNTTNAHYLTIFYNGSGATAMGNYSANIETSALTLTSTSGNNGDPSQNVIGSYLSSTTHGWNGYVFEFIIFPSQVSGSDLTNLQTYLNKKWGL